MVLSKEAAGFQCSVCQRNYKRREHLQRHFATHNQTRPYECNICSRAFSRVDVLHRHHRTCEAKLLGIYSTSSKRKACEFCIRQKKACSIGRPCQNCASRNLECRYSSAADEPQSNSYDLTATERSHASGALTPMAITASTSNLDTSFLPAGELAMDIAGMLASSSRDVLGGETSWTTDQTWMDFLSLVQPTPQAPDLSDGNRNDEGHDTNKAYTFRFLDNFTSQTGLVESFDCGTLELRQQTIAASLDQESAKYIDSQVAIASSNLNAAEPLATQTHQIVNLAKEVTVSKARNSIIKFEWALSLEQDCFDFFSPPKIRKYLNLYWTIWHPNVNIIHRPTFNSCKVKPELLAAMVVIGESEV